MKKLFFALVMMALGYTSFAQNTNKLFNDYIALKNALVNGDNKAASESAITLLKSIKEDGDFAEKKNLLKATENMTKANTLEKQRASLNDVSTSMWKLVKNSDKVKDPVYYQYCPMKKAYWLSKEKEIKNPYYGSAMLTCGKVSETK